MSIRLFSPAVLFLLHRTISVANQLNKEVSVCGELAGDPRFTRLLMKMGLRRFSMHPANVLAVKDAVRHTHLDKLTVSVEDLLAAPDEATVDRLLETLND